MILTAVFFFLFSFYFTEFIVAMKIASVADMALKIILLQLLLLETVVLFNIFIETVINFLKIHW